MHYFLEYQGLCLQIPNTNEHIEASIQLNRDGQVRSQTSTFILLFGQEALSELKLKTQAISLRNSGCKGFKFGVDWTPTQLLLAHEDIDNNYI